MMDCENCEFKKAFEIIRNSDLDVFAKAYIRNILEIQGIDVNKLIEQCPTSREEKTKELCNDCHYDDPEDGCTY